MADLNCLTVLKRGAYHRISSDVFAHSNRPVELGVQACAYQQPWPDQRDQIRQFKKGMVQYRNIRHRDTGYSQHK